jgi:hypothetical protein
VVFVYFVKFASLPTSVVSDHKTILY